MSEARIFPVDTEGVSVSTQTQHRASIIESTAQISPLLYLPAELRNSIYKYALLQGNIQLYPGIMADRRPEDMPDLALLRTCHQIRCEASLIFYNINTFEFEFTFDIPKFVQSLTEQNRQSIRSIRLQPGSIYNLVGEGSARYALFLLPSLEELHFRGHLCGEVWDELATTVLRLDGKSMNISAD